MRNEMGLKTFYSTPLANKYSFYLYEIGAPEEYVDWFEVIRNASENDLIKIHINSPGGRIDTTLQLLRAMQDCPGTIVTSVEGMCASAATMVFLYADSFEVSPNSNFMFHNYSGGAMGKGGELYDQITFEKPWLEKFMRESYEHILTEEEIDRMLIGKDIYKTSEEMLDLLQARVEKIKAEEEAAATAEEEITKENETDIRKLAEQPQPETILLNEKKVAFDPEADQLGRVEGTEVIEEINAP